MGEFNDMLAEGFGEMIAEAGINLSITTNNVTQTCKVVPASQPREKELVATGYWKVGQMVVEMTRANASALGVSERVICTCNNTDWQILTVDDDPGEPCLRLTLQPYR